MSPYPPYQPTVVKVIAPRDINTKKHFWDAFGKCETESAALWIVMLMQSRGMWSSFTHTEIQNFYRASNKSHADEDFDFCGLDSGGYLTKKRYRYEVTPGFITRCHESSPARKPRKAKSK